MLQQPDKLDNWQSSSSKQRMTQLHGHRSKLEFGLRLEQWLRLRLERRHEDEHDKMRCGGIIWLLSRLRTSRCLRTPMTMTTRT